MSKETYFYRNDKYSGGADDRNAFYEHLKQRREQLKKFLQNHNVHYTEDEDGEVIVTNTEDAEVISVETAPRAKKLLGE